MKKVTLFVFYASFMVCLHCKKSSGSDSVIAIPAVEEEPSTIVADAWGNLYIPDGRIAPQRITAEGHVSGFAGSGVRGSTDGAPANAAFDQSWAITIDSKVRDTNEAGNIGRAHLLTAYAK